MVVVGSKYTGAGFIFMSVLGTVLRDIRGVSPHPHNKQGSFD
jgi:hypothetical protein